MKTIMILGAGRGQVGLYKAAKAMGHKSVAVSIKGDYPGFALADEIDYTDITDAEAVLEAAKRHGADAVVSACVDITIPAVGYVCDKMGLCGISHEAAVTSTNKMLMKKAFEKAGVRTARFVELYKGEDPAEKSSHLRKPLIVKAVDLCGSKGINIVMDGMSLEDAVSATMSETNLDYCIIEEYLDGYEFSATSFIVDGKVLFNLPMGDVRYGKNDEIPAGHYLPFEGDAEIIEDTITQMTNGIYALGLVLYRLCNENKGPFIDLSSGTLRPSDAERAHGLRLSGIELPAPAHASADLAKIIAKAVRFRPEERYRDAKQLKDALEELDRLEQSL